MYTTIDQIESFLNNRSTSGIKPGLERVKTLLETAENPEQQLRGIHVAGTNGKGSTIVFMSEALQQNDYQVGVFTSPSFQGLNGHIMINDAIMSEDAFVKAFNQLEPTIQYLADIADPPTSFEIVTVIAFMYFKANADIALIEAGMGGRYDTTNVLEPILSIITNVSYDHTAYLGTTIESIASHKAGIIKPFTPVITGMLNDDTKKVVQSEARQKQAHWYQLGEAFTYTIHDSKYPGHYIWENQEMSLHITTALKGHHQINNSALAVMALVLLRHDHFPISCQKALYGLSKAQLPGRFEQVHQSPDIIIDGAHNPNGMSVFLQAVEENVKYTKKTLLFAAFRDKDIQTMLDMAAGVFDYIILTTFDHDRAADKKDFEQMGLTDNFTSYESSWKDVLTKILQDGHTDHHYYVAGSLHFIKKVRQYIATIGKK